MRAARDELVMLFGQRLTPARLAVFGAAAFVPALRAWSATLPPGCNRAALSELRGHSFALSQALRLWLDAPESQMGREAERAAARLCAEWQEQAAHVHPVFTPLNRLPADRAERGLDALGFPIGSRSCWPQPAKGT
jgi:hypothetical protein